ncbi:MAG TPA: glucoamylase family protein [Flavitalea sp.]|nr:glucoamylase family protein [Flavitalea sp.]
MRFYTPVILLLIFAACTRQLRPPVKNNLTDEQILDLVQQQTFRYFWDFGDPVSGLSRERSNPTKQFGNEVSTIGGTGFGIMCFIVAAERKWKTREEVCARLLKMLKFLEKADRFHGMFPHWMNGTTGKTIPFSDDDNGADIVESSYLFAALIAAKEYFNKETKDETEIRSVINNLWNEAEWDWFTKGENVLYWHWSPDKQWKMNQRITGYNECLITYVLAASSPAHSISPDVYQEGWTDSKNFLNGNKYYKIKLPLGSEYGGPLFFSHYSFLGLDPTGLKDKYADYWMQNKNHTLINRQYCLHNPKKYKGYGENCWGLTASDNHRGYASHSPTEDLGVITPTAALSSFPYTPEYSMKALRHFYGDLGNKIWTKYGFADAFNETQNWYADSHLAIDQGPIIVMIENYRSGLLWKMFMKNADVRKGLKKLGFESPYLNN